MEKTMNLKTFSVLLPAYKKPNHRGQTPEIYDSRLSQKFERALCERCVRVLRQRMGEAVFLDKSNGEIEIKPFIRYEITVDNDTPALAEIVSLALASFSLTQISVTRQESETLDFTPENAEELSIGAHAWNDANE